MAAPLILAEVKPRRTSDGAPVTVRLAGGGGTLPYRYAGVGWSAGIAGLPTIVASIDFKGDDLGGGGVSQAMVLRWTPSRPAMLAELAALHWLDAEITVRLGVEGSMPPVLLTGKVLRATAQAGMLEITLADPAADLKKPVLTARFAGTGGLEGPIEWEGRIKPRAWGRVFNVQGDAIDVANSVYCFGDPARPWLAFDAVRDKGAAAAQLSVLAWQGSAAATFTALMAATAPQGGGIVCPSIACVKWWTQPAGALCADIRGEVGTGYVETAPEIAERVAAVVSTVPFAAGTVAAAAAKRPIPIGWLVADESNTAAQVLDQILGDVSLMWLLGDTEINIRAWEWGASVARARSHEVSRRTTFKPVSKRKLGYRRNQHVMSRDAIAGIVLATDVVFDDGVTAEDLKPAAPGATPGAPGGTIVGGVLDPVTGGVIGGVEAGELVDTMFGMQAALGDLDALVDGQIVRLDGRIDGANARVDDVEDALAGETARLDGRVSEANEAIARARVVLAYQYGRLQVEIAQTRIGVVAEYRERVSAVGAQITRIDGIIANLADPATGLPAAHALIATLESITIDLENPLSLASKLAVLEVALDEADAALRARVSSLETASVQQATDLADLAGGVAIIDDRLIAAEQGVAANAGGLVSLSGTVTEIAAQVDIQGDDIAETQAGLTEVSQAVALEHSAGVYRAQRALARAGLTAVSVLAETRIRVTEREAIYDAIDVVDLKLDAPGIGAVARLSAAESAIVSLDSSKASVSSLNALSAVVTSHGERLATAEAGVSSHTAAIATLNLDLDGLSGSLGLVAADLAALDNRVGDVEGVAASLVTVTNTLTATAAAQGGAIGDLEGAVAAAEAEITGVKRAGATDRAAIAYEAERSAATIGLNRVAALAERSVSLTATAAAATRLTALELSLGDPADGVLARIADLDTITADLVTGKASASSVNALSLRMGDAEAGITAVSSIAVEANGIAKAIHGLRMTVGNKISGVVSENNGELATFRVAADYSSFEDPDTGKVFLEMTEGELRINDAVIRIVGPGGTMMKVTGVGFGSTGQFIEWFGPKQTSLSTCTEANAVYYLKGNGSAYFGGSLTGGVRKNAVQTTAIATTAAVTTGVIGSGGGARVVTLGYNYQSFAQITGACPATPTLNATIQLYRGTDSSGVHLTTLYVVDGAWNCTPGAGEFEPGGWSVSMGGSLTYTDNSGGLSASYYAVLIGRTALVGDSVTQQISLISIEE